MALTRKYVSLHGLDNDQAVDLNDDDNNNNNNIGNLTISLDDIYDSISLCDTSRDLNSKRLTWEEWYVKKAMEEAASGKESARSKIDRNRNRATVSETEKTKKLVEWLEKKRAEKERLDAEQRKIKEENEKQKAKKELDKKKADEKYEKWLTELKLNEMARKQKIAEQKRLREQREAQEKARRAELALKMAENKKQLIKVRKLEERKGVAIVNGKLRAYYDWSTSPDPTFLNKDTWKS